jgi:hypothetical protein
MKRDIRPSYTNSFSRRSLLPRRPSATKHRPNNTYYDFISSSSLSFLRSSTSSLRECSHSFSLFIYLGNENRRICSFLLFVFLNCQTEAACVSKKIHFKICGFDSFFFEIIRKIEVRAQMSIAAFDLVSLDAKYRWPILHYGPNSRADQKFTP